MQCNAHTSTTLNLQQEEVLSELYNHVNQQPSPSDQAYVQTTLSYLEACSKLFEKGFLSHDRVISLESEVIKNIQSGFNFFSGWIDALLKKSTIYLHTHYARIYILIMNLIYLHPKYPLTSPKQKEFLSWQSKCTCNNNCYIEICFCLWQLGTYRRSTIMGSRFSVNHSNLHTQSILYHH